MEISGNSPISSSPRTSDSQVDDVSQTPESTTRAESTANAEKTTQAFQQRYQADSFTPSSSTRGPVLNPTARASDSNTQMQKMADDYQQQMKASTEIQTQLGEAQSVAQTAQQAVGGAKAASRPS